MDRLRRRLFFWSLVAAFFVIAPLVILHARGYRFDFGRGVFVYSGAITIKSNPQSTNVTLNGKPEASKTTNQLNNSYNFTGLLPDDYEISVSAPGFRSWDKKTDVHSGLAKEFWNVLLVRENYDLINYADTNNTEKFFISPKNDYIAYTKNDENGLSISVLNISGKKTEKNYPFSGWSFLDESKKENIEWSPQDDYLSVPLERQAQNKPTVNSKNNKLPIEQSTSTEYKYFIVDRSNDNIINLNDFLGKNDIRSVRWDPAKKDYLFFLSANTLFRANVKNASDIVEIAGDVTSFDLTRSNVYYVQLPNNLVYKSNLDGTSTKEQMTNNFPDSDKIIERIVMYDDSRFALISQDKDLYIYNEGEHDNYFRKLGSSVEGIHFSDDGKKMLFWNTNEISVYFTRDWNVQPVRAEDDLTGITRYGDPISNVQWFKDYEHVIFNTGKWLKIIELDSRDHRNCMDLTNTVLENPVVRYNNSLEYLFFTDQKDGATSINSIAFPEPTPILGIGG